MQILKPKRSRACALQQETPPQRETHAPQLESSPSSPQLEKAREQQQRPSATKNKYIFKSSFISFLFRFHIEGMSYDISFSLYDFTQYDGL